MRPLAARPALVEAALWFHDAIYDSRSATNEKDNARLAGERLAASGVCADQIETVRNSSSAPRRVEPDAALLIDLAILGQPAARFWDYELGGRASLRKRAATCNCCSTTSA